MITVVGSLNMDLVIEVPRFPAPGETVAGTNFRRVCGGKGANQACAAARMGHSAALIGAVGRDAFGEELLANLQSAGVNTANVAQRDDTATGTAMILLNAEGQNQIVVANGSNDFVPATQIERSRAAIESCRALLVQLETPLDSVTAALKMARAANVLTILNPAPFAPLPDDVLGLCDVLIPNESEASALTGIQVCDLASAGLAAKQLRHRANAAVLVTLGDKGVWLDTPAFTGHVRAFLVDAVDTVGAGDTFIGAFAVRLVEGADFKNAARFGCAAAALAVTRRGAQASIPNRTDVEAFLATAASR